MAASVGGAPPAAVFFFGCRFGVRCAKRLSTLSERSVREVVRRARSPPSASPRACMKSALTLCSVAPGVRDAPRTSIVSSGPLLRRELASDPSSDSEPG